MPHTGADRIEEVHSLSKAMDAAAQVAVNLALQVGASKEEISQTLAQARERFVQQSAQTPEPVGELERALHVLEGRRLFCRALAILALEHGVDKEELTRQMESASKAGIQIYRAKTLTDLGIWEA